MGIAVVALGVRRQEGSVEDDGKGPVGLRSRVTVDRGDGPVGPDLGYHGHVGGRGGVLGAGPVQHEVAGGGQSELEQPLPRRPVEDGSDETVTGDADTDLVPHPGGEERAPLLARTVGVAERTLGRRRDRDRSDRRRRSRRPGPRVPPAGGSGVLNDVEMESGWSSQ